MPSLTCGTGELECHVHHLISKLQKALGWACRLGSFDSGPDSLSKYLDQVIRLGSGDSNFPTFPPRLTAHWLACLPLSDILSKYGASWIASIPDFLFYNLSHSRLLKSVASRRKT
eukprot:1140364-Pelagomonas_calceolata.AAC.1